MKHIYGLNEYAWNHFKLFLMKSISNGRLRVTDIHGKLKKGDTKYENFEGTQANKDQSKSK